MKVQHYGSAYGSLSQLHRLLQEHDHLPCQTCPSQDMEPKFHQSRTGTYRAKTSPLIGSSSAGYRCNQRRLGSELIVNFITRCRLQNADFVFFTVRGACALAPKIESQEDHLRFGGLLWLQNRRELW